MLAHVGITTVDAESVGTITFLICLQAEGIIGTSTIVHYYSANRIRLCTIIVQTNLPVLIYAGDVV